MIPSTYLRKFETKKKQNIKRQKKREKNNRLERMFFEWYCFNQEVLGKVEGTKKRAEQLKNFGKKETLLHIPRLITP